MATSDGSDIFKCKVCQNHMLYKTPRWLNCFHSFCSECLQNLFQNGQIKCPICFKVTILEGNDLSRLTVNSTIQEFSNVLETELSRKRLKVNDESSRLMCQICQAAEVEFHCKDCSQLMCESCNKGHGNIEDMKSHLVANLCVKHKDWVTHICAECVLPLCMKCMVLDHREHNKNFLQYNKGMQELKTEMVSLQQKVGQKQTELENCLKGLQVKKQTSAQLKDALRAKAGKYGDKVEANKTKIKELQNEIKKDEENIAETEQLMNEIDDELEKNEKYEKKISECIEAADTMSENLCYITEDQSYFLSRYKNIRQETILSIENMEKLVNLYTPQYVTETTNTNKYSSEAIEYSSESDDASECVQEATWIWELKNIKLSGIIAMFEEDILAVQQQAVIRLNQTGEEVTKYYPETNSTILDITVFANNLYILQQQWITIIDLETNEQMQALNIRFLNVSKILIKDCNTIFLMECGNSQSKVYKYYVQTGKSSVMTDILENPTKFEPIQTRDGIRYLITVKNSLKLQMYEDLGERWVLIRSLKNFKLPETHEMRFDFTVTTEKGTLLVLLKKYDPIGENNDYTVYHINLSGELLSQVPIEHEKVDPIWPLGLIVADSCLVSLWGSRIKEQIPAQHWSRALTSVEVAKCLKIQYGH